MPVYLFALLSLATFFICVAARPIGQRLQLLDLPDGLRKLHSEPTPLVGGFAISLPVALLSLVLGLVIGDFAQLGGLALAILGFFALGVVDDRFNLSPAVRLLCSVLLILLTLNVVPEFRVQNLTFSFFDAPLSISSWHYVFNLVVIVGFIYALNMADGVDGLVAGLAIIWTGLLMVFAPDHFIPVLVALLSGLVVFFVFNIRKRLFLGDSGSYSLAICIGLLSIATYNENQGNLAADTVAIWLIIPVMDCLRLIALRVAQGSSPLSADNNHLHHVLLRRFPRIGVLTIYFSLVAIPSGLAASWPEHVPLWAAFAVIGYCISLTMGYRGSGRQQHKK